jgi:hypothetical protein
MGETMTELIEIDNVNQLPPGVEFMVFKALDNVRLIEGMGIATVYALHHKALKYIEYFAPSTLKSEEGGENA